MAVRTNLLLPEDLPAEVDRVAGPRNRSRFVADALRARLRWDRLKAADALIAATAHVDGAALLTRNVREFALTPVRIEAY